MECLNLCQAVRYPTRRVHSRKLSGALLLGCVIGVMSPVQAAIRTVVDNAAPILSLVTVTSISDNSALIVWNTDEVADSLIEFGHSGSLIQRRGELDYSQTHSLVLSRLQPATVYQLRISATDPSENTVTSELISFTTTAGADLTSPAFTLAPVISDITETGAQISWSTDEFSSQSVVYGLRPEDLGSMASAEGLMSDHQVSLSGLLPGATYYLKVLSEDISQNIVQSAIITMQTLGQQQDTDGDGMSDPYEVAWRLDPNSPSDGGLDADGDGLSNYQEFQFATNPTLADSDMDGATDSEEIAANTDPLDSQSAPGQDSLDNLMPSRGGWRVILQQGN